MAGRALEGWNSPRGVFSFLGARAGSAGDQLSLRLSEIDKNLGLLLIA